MASSQRPDTQEAGYATAAAMVLGLALSLVATAMVGRSVMTLRLVRADLERAQVEYILDGAQLAAAATTIRAGAGGPYRWALPTDAGFAEVLVESEVDKLTPAAAASLPEAVFAAMAVNDIATLKARLSASVTDVHIEELDTAPLWRECGPSLASGLGRQTTPTVATPAEPRLRPETPDWRVGEAWRIRVTTAAGWRDDRIVRFTGDARHPVAVVRRRLSRGDGGQGKCDAVFAAVG